ncbi:MAG: hypothetical protein ACLFUU_09760, partial [Desulfobacteraceae bacterium]
MCAPGADLAGSAWVKTVEAPRFQGLALQHFYRTVALLADAGFREVYNVISCFSLDKTWPAPGNA